MAIDKKIIKSFYLQDELNPEVWDSNKSEVKPKLNSEIRDRLLKIANLFIDFLGIDKNW